MRAWAPKLTPGARVGWADTGVVNRNSWVAGGREATPKWHQVSMESTHSTQPTLLLDWPSTAPEHTYNEIAELFGVARSAVHLAIARSERQQQASGRTARPRKEPG